MNLKKIIFSSFNSILKNPTILLPGVALWIVLQLFSLIPNLLKPYLQSTFALTSWLIISAILLLAILSFFFSGLVGLSLELNNQKKPSLKTFLSYAKRFWLLNTIVLILLRIFSIAIEQAAFFSTSFLVNFFSISTIGKQIFSATLSPAAFTFILIYFAGLAGILIFLTLSSPCLIVFNTDLLNSFKKSFRIVKRNYLDVLVVSVLFFILFEIINRIPHIVGGILEYIFIVPLLSLILSYIVIAARNQIR